MRIPSRGREPTARDDSRAGFARSFMELHDGAIAVEPRLGGGTWATLTFPASRIATVDC